MTDSIRDELAAALRSLPCALTDEYGLCDDDECSRCMALRVYDVTPSAPSPLPGNRCPSAEQYEALLEGTTPGPWEMWTSNSFRRISQKHGKDGGVLCAVKHNDGCADLHFGNGGYEGPDARLMLAAPDLARAAASLARENAELRKWRDDEVHDWVRKERLQSAERERDAAKEKVRALVAKWRDRAIDLYYKKDEPVVSDEVDDCADELEAIFAATADKEQQAWNTTNPSELFPDDIDGAPQLLRELADRTYNRMASRIVPAIEDWAEYEAALRDSADMIEGMRARELDAARTPASPAVTAGDDPVRALVANLRERSVRQRHLRSYGVLSTQTDKFIRELEAALAKQSQPAERWRGNGV